MADDESVPSPRTRPSRLRLVVVAAIGLLLLLFLFSSGLARLYTDYLWFDRLGQSSVWSTILSTRVLLGLVFGLVFFVALYGNLWLADRLAPTGRLLGPEDELIERYQAAIGRHSGKVRFGLAALFGLIAGANTSANWETYILWANDQQFGWSDPLFDRDAGFYVFRLPFWSFLIDWAFASMIFVLLIVAAAHYLNGGIRAAATGTKVVPRVKVHLSALLFVMALLRAAAYWFDRYDLVTSSRGSFTGALATDVNIQLPALNLLVLISLFCGALFLANLRRGGWGLPVMAIGLWFLSHVVVGGIVPAIYQRLRVDPVVSQREEPFIQRNMDATRFAYGLDEDRLDRIDIVLDDSFTGADINTYGDVFDQTLLFDPELASEAFDRDQAVRSFYQFADRLDVDRYMIDGELTPVIVGARGLDVTQSPVASNWENQHVAYTHGYGVVVAPGNPGQAQNVDYVVSGLGDDLTIAETFSRTLVEPRVYFGEDFGGYSIVGATRDEVDFTTSANRTSLTRYEGPGGVPISSLTRRMSYALRFQDFDFLISQFVDVGTSRVIYNRDIEERVRELAPFLEFDADPYPVIADGRTVWIIDAYTTTAEFPYSQHLVSSDSFVEPADLQGRLNYVRNSVKAVVDAYSGEVTFYVVDDGDPLIAAYQQAFPDLFTDDAEAPADIVAHFRYPQDIFKVQTDILSRYYVDDPVSFLQGDLAWDVAIQPAQAASTPALSIPQRPQYLVTRLPGEEQTEFVLQRGFVPVTGRSFNEVTGEATGEETQRPELTAIMMARSDPANFGELVLFQLPTSFVDAPDLVNSEIQKNPEVSRQITLNGQQGSEVKFGEMQTLLVGDSVVFVRPFYLVAEGANAKPELRFVIAVSGERIGLSTDLEGALREVTVAGAPAPQELDDNGDPIAVEPSGDLGTLSVAELVNRIDQLLADAETADAAGDTTTAGLLRGEAIAAVGQLEILLGIADPLAGE